MPNQITIPALPCASITATLDFYVALGFEITYQQTRPNNYGCVKYEDIELHFFTMKDYDPANSYSTCMVLIEDADSLHATFAANLRQQLGKLPVAGIPRITKPNNKNGSGDWRFNVVDPGGNYIRFIQQGAVPEVAKPTTNLARAINAADWLATGKGDFPAAAKLLDAALAKQSDETPVQQVQALVLRAEIAVNMTDHALAQALLTDLSRIPLSDQERLELADTLEKAEDLAQLLP